MKTAVIDWITPAGESLAPPLSRRHKNDRGFHHEATGALLCPANLSWDDPEWVLSSIYTSFKFLTCAPLVLLLGQRGS